MPGEPKAGLYGWLGAQQPGIQSHSAPIPCALLPTSSASREGVQSKRGQKDRQCWEGISKTSLDFCFLIYFFFNSSWLFSDPS